ncbi:unnamed protein product [Diatraea saccharalis]|uniref:Uncharacterized protein n=1 Tax=Diatraea saccharalis TaxID=40085 RepID=A0A9N9RA22_9NEOP|nr:unnamed protein product [Diatraea saccharalis]
MNCAGCGIHFSDNNYLKCNACTSLYCLACLNINENSINEVNSKQLEKLKCPSCSNVTKRKNDDCSPARPRRVTGTLKPATLINDNSSSSTTPVHQENNNLILEEIRQLRNDMNLRFEAQQANFEKSNAILSKLKNEVNDLGNSISSIRSDLDGAIGSLEFLSKCHDNQIKINNETKSTISELAKDNASLRSQMGDLTIKLTFIEQQARDCNIEIQCVPEFKNENLLTCFKQLIKTISLDVPDAGILSLHRVAKSNVDSKRPRNIIVKLSNPRVRDGVLAAVKDFNRRNQRNKLNATHLGIASEKVPIIVTEHLSPCLYSLIKTIMSRKRAQYLVQLSKNKDCELITSDIISEIPNWNDERRSSPLPKETETPEFRALLHHIFDETSKNECDYSYTTGKGNDLTTCHLMKDKDINLNVTGLPSTPIVDSPQAVDIIKPSSMVMTPLSVEPLFSISSTDCQHFYDEEGTPVPSPYCDFQDTSSLVYSDETLVPVSHEDTSILPTGHNIASTQNIFSDSPVDSSYSNRYGITSPSPIESLQSSAVFSPTTMNESDYTDISTPKNEEMRADLFSQFWGTGSHVKQWQIISKYVIQKNKKTATNLDESSRRSHTFHYHLPLYNPATKTNTLQKVCKTMFLNTFNISKDFAYTALRKNQDCNDFTDITDDRGRHKHHATSITIEMKQGVIDHVNSFVPIESHYVRKCTNKKYLDPSLSFSKMFKLYLDWCCENNYSNKVKTVRQYRDIVNANLKIGFYLPKKDQCDVCHQFKNTPNPSDEIKDNFNKHQTEKEISRKLKLESKMFAISNNKIACSIVFDFQKVLNSPHGNISVYYYRRKLNVYNLTLFDMASKEAFCYMWDETIAKRGANEVASCLYNFISKLVSKGISEFHLWSDNCGGQNRNRIVYYMYLLASQNFNIKICHRFMEKGHTQNEGDSEVYSPDEWYSLVRWAKVNDKPYNVIEVNQEMILDFKAQIVSNKNWTKNFNKEKVS